MLSGLRPLLFGMSLFATAMAMAAPYYNVNDYYQVYKDNRIYVFDDFKTYDDFLNLGETPFRLTRIGAGPKGETVVFGLQKKDKKMRSGIGSVDLYDGKAEAIKEGFYGEIVKDGRIYIFNDWNDMKSFIQVGEAPYRFTQIGTGPNHETLVFVLNKHNKKKHPSELIAAYRHHHTS